jgi:hypothetical protein
MLHSSDDPADLTPEERRREIAVILARGVLRLLRTRHLATQPEPTAEAPEPLDKDLEMSETSRVHVTTGSRN